MEPPSALSIDSDISADANHGLPPVSGDGYEHLNDTSQGVGNDPGIKNTNDDFEVLCGPLLNYKHMNTSGQSISIWNGSVMVVAKPGQRQPILQLRPLGPVYQAQEQSQVNGDGSLGPNATTIEGVKLYADPNKTFWRFPLSLPLELYEARWEYSIQRFKYVTDKLAKSSWNFIVPSSRDSMRIMFHSCNGFSVGTDLDHWQGPLLWNDVLRLHKQKPFHVMIGGGDQIYNDSVRVTGPLKEWTAIANPQKRRSYPFSNTMRLKCDDFYFDNYLTWYGTEPFATANSQIPQVNIWDDHDIIDGFGSYTDHFMKCPVFRGIGGVAFKYYCLFQHHNAPPMSTFTTDAPETMEAVNGTSGADPRQLENTYVYREKQDEPSWIVGAKPGPYVEERSRNFYMRLGRRIAFVGIDARTERTRHQVNYPETYDIIFSRLEKELAAADGEIKHIILLLGVPIAYPRLAWLENVINSPIIAPIRLLNRRFGVGGDLFNKFDGQVDLLDDLDDHYTARQHKRERRDMIQRFQDLSRQFSARVTILGGDVHLAAVGRFYSRVKDKIPVEKDPKYMTNLISSAITNKPPPKAVANLLARRNKIHHMDHTTDETLMKLFDKQPGGKEKGAAFNKVTMPSRNFACITEVDLGKRTNAEEQGDVVPTPSDGHDPLHLGELNAGTTYGSADGMSNVTGMVGGLDIAIRVEIDPADREGTTEGYGFSVPPLVIPAGEEKKPRHRFHRRHHSKEPLREEEQSTAA